MGAAGQPVVRIAAFAALAFAFGYAPVDGLHIWRDVRNAYSVSRARRADTPALSVGLQSAREVERAAHVIPPTARFAVLVGPAAALRGSQSRDYVKFWALFTLLPRRAVPHARDADWVVLYGIRSGAAGVRLGRVVDLGGGVEVAEVRR